MININEISGSFPFFDIARKTGLPYWLILKIAGEYDAGQGKEYDVTCEPASLIHYVCQAPWRFDLQIKIARDEALRKCAWCGKAYAEHETSPAPDAPVPRMPCLGLKGGFVGKKPK